MTLGARLKMLRKELGLSQEAIGAQGFVSTPGWIKIENGQRRASEKFIEKLSLWLVHDKYMRAGAAAALKDELLTLKYLGSPSKFLQEIARAHARNLPTAETLLAAEEPGTYGTKPRRGRPPGKKK